MKHSASDVLYKIKFLDKFDSAYLYVLAEHQSNINNWMPFRLWQYIIAIWNEHLKKNKKDKLPLVVPLVFYNGRKRYDGTRDIRELIDAPMDLIDYFLLKPFQLIDTHDIVDEELKNQHWAGLMEFVMKHAFEREAMHYIQYFIQLIRGVAEDKNSDDFLASVLKYYTNQVETANPDGVKETLEIGLSEFKEGEMMTTLASYFREQGVQKGLQKGLQEGESIILLRLLELKFGVVPQLFLDRIREAESNDLLRWAEKVLEANSLEAIFDK